MVEEGDDDVGVWAGLVDIGRGDGANAVWPVCNALSMKDVAVEVNEAARMTPHNKTTVVCVGGEVTLGAPVLAPVTQRTRRNATHRRIYLSQWILPPYWRRASISLSPSS